MGGCSHLRWKRGVVTGTNDGSGSVSIIYTTTNDVTDTMSVGDSPTGVAIIQK